MIPGAWPGAKWAVPPAVGLFAMAIDSTPVVVGVLAFLQAVTLAYFGLRQHRSEVREANETRRIEAEQKAQGVKLDGSDRLINQLQEQLEAEVKLRAEDRATIRKLEAELAELGRKFARTEIGVDRLHAQLATLGVVPVWPAA